MTSVLWLRKKLGNVFWVQDALWKIFYDANKNLINDFLSGRYVDKISGIPMLGFYMFKKKTPYLPLMNLSNHAQVDFYSIEIYENFALLNDEHTEQGVLFLFRSNDLDLKNISHDTDLDLQTSDVTLADLNAYGMHYQQLLISDLSLDTLLTLFSMIFEPLLNSQEHSSEPSISHTSKQSTTSDMSYLSVSSHANDLDFLKKDVLMAHILRFEQAIGSTAQKLSGGITLTAPQELLDAMKSDYDMKEPAMVALLEVTCNGWLSQLQDTLNSLEDMYFEGTTPMRELSYWRDRYTTLDMISKQLKSNDIDTLIEIQNARTGLMTPSISRLESLLIEAKENNRFLSTCERHFKNIEMGSNYHIVIESIVPLMKSLRLIWMISKHYNDDEKMMSLMDKVAKVLIDRVKRLNNLQTIFKNSPEKVQARMANASTLLKLWKQAYLETRHFIETSGRGTRWEFDRKRLFLMTDYLASVCQDIGNSVQLIDEFNHLYELNIFTVTMKQARVAEMKQSVHNLLFSFQNIKFDPYDPANERLWFLKMETFQKELTDIELMSQLYIQDAFRNIRSPIMGIQLLKSLNRVLERSSLSKTLNEKLKDINVSFLNQVEKTRQDFIDNSMNPPLFKSQPPVSGAIHWQKFMFSRLKNILLSLLAEHDFMTLEHAEKLKESYLSLCREMKDYSQNKYKIWVDKAGLEVEQLLKAPIFVLPNQKIEILPKVTQPRIDSSFLSSVMYNSKASTPASLKSNTRSSRAKQEVSSVQSDPSSKVNKTSNSNVSYKHSNGLKKVMALTNYEGGNGASKKSNRNANNESGSCKRSSTSSNTSCKTGYFNSITLSNCSGSTNDGGTNGNIYKNYSMNHNDDDNNNYNNSNNNCNNINNSNESSFVSARERNVANAKSTLKEPGRLLVDEKASPSLKHSEGRSFLNAVSSTGRKTYPKVLQSMSQKKSLLPFKSKPVPTVMVMNESLKEVTTVLEVDLVKENVIEINFDPYLFEIILEAKHLEAIGYFLPESVKNAVLLEQSFHDKILLLTSFISQYNKEIENLTKVDFMVLEEHIKNLFRVVFSGTKRINWRTACIPDFIDSCKNTLEEFLSIVYQYKKDISRIEMRVESIEKASFLSDKVIHNVGLMLDCKEYFECLKADRDEIIRKLASEYEDITSIIQHIGFIIWKNNSWKCNKMKPFYSYYENRVYQALTSMVLTNLRMFAGLLSNQKTLFQIYGVLYHPYLNLNPNQVNVLKYITQCALDCVYSTKYFPRWLDGSAVPVAASKEDEETCSYTFLNEIALNPEVISLIKKIQSTADGILNRANDVLLPWGRFEVVWQSDKELMVQEWIDKTNPRATDYDDALFNIKTQLSEIAKINDSVDIDSIKLNLAPLVASVSQHYAHLFDIYIHELHLVARHALVSFKNDCEKKLEEISFKPISIEHLKTVLQLLNEISNSEVERFLTVKELREKYDVLGIYEVTLSDEEKLLLDTIDILDKFLTDKAKNCSHKLTFVKRRFAEIASKEATEFYHLLEEFVERFEREGPGAVDDLEVGLSTLRDFTNEAARLEEKKLDITNSQKLFDLPLISSNAFTQVLKKIVDVEVVYKIFKNYLNAKSEWEMTQWSELDVGILQEGIDNFILQVKKLPANIRDLKIWVALRDTLKSFKNNLPIIVELKNEALRERHWKTLIDLTKINMDTSDLSNILLKNIFAMNLDQYNDIVSEIIINAIKEASIEKSIKELDYTWSTMKFILLKYNKSSVDKGKILGSVDELNTLLDDHIMQLQGMSASRNIGPFLASVQLLEKQLSSISETIYLWVNAQRKWLYLDSIFMLSDIKVQLPEEARLFDKLDKIYTQIMKATLENPIVKVACLEPGRLRTLEELIFGLDKCQKSLIEYLDSKRNLFPRFYFISDEELLSIIGSTDPQSIQEHIIKMFDNVKSLEFVQRGSQLEVLGMVSAEGEEMKFRSRTMADGKVELWMNNVLLAMQSSNRIITKEAIFYYCINGMSRISWMMKYQGMVALAGDQVWWTWEVEDVFEKTAKGNKHAMKTYYKKLVNQLDDLVLVVRKPLESNARKKLNTILIIDVHARDIIEAFVRDSVLTANDFCWESQLRFYWSFQPDQLMVQQCSGWFKYGYEYMGLNGRLVITPLTDRIYLTLTQALSLKLGGAPAGPAGTGKTETTKDLAKALGLLCMVTNCGEGMDYKALGKIFAGLCQCGCWGCFDEFNRIEISVLSVVSSQLQTIKNALMLNMPQFYFEGEIIQLDNKLGIFITMNPGYAGRTELPESIKALFRPVVCIVPDSQMICEIMLFSEGFLMAKVLAKKMTVLYKLAMEQLSKQYHYDFQLRAIKAVLVMAGELKRTSDADEDVTLMRSLRDMNLPKFVFEDVLLFHGLIGDLFPGLNCPRVQYPEYNDAIEESLKENRYVILPHQVDKVVQLYETMLTRHTTMVVGPTCGGKSVVINTLAAAQTKLGIPTKLYTLNPKERSVVELYGSLDTVSRDWTDGLLSNIFREINKPTDKVERKYIVFDGDVDALWVENMNSVMDDNRLLTLANGERIRLQKHCSLLFEVSDLQYAQPSTVSRCGMVYVDPKNLKYDPYWDKWLDERFLTKQDSSEMENLQKLYVKYVPACIDLIFEGKHANEKKEPLKSIIPLSNLNLIKQLTYLLEALFDQEELDLDLMECLFVEALYWSLGIVLLEDDRVVFDAFVKSISGMTISKNDEVKMSELPGANSTVFDFIFDHDSQHWVKWSSKIPAYIHDEKLKFYEILVPTKTTVSLKWAVNLFLKRGIPVLLSGESGTSKTVTVNNFLKGLDQDLYQLLAINFSSRTTSLDCQRNIENSTEKRTRDIYGPALGKKLVIFVDDLNMPQVDAYGTQQPIAMLKQLIGYSGIYDRGSTLNWKYLKDLEWVASMGNPGGGRNHVDPRFISLFSFIYVVFPSEDSIFHIYNTILESCTSQMSDEILTCRKTITSMSMELFKTIMKDLPPTPSKFHYIFSLRDLSRLYGGLCLMSPSVFVKRCDVVRLWRHECLRVFTDKLTNEQDYETVAGKIRSLIEQNFVDCANDAMQNPILYGDFKTFLSDIPSKLYEDLESFENVKKILDDILEEYELTHKKAGLVLFNDAIAHLCRIYRIIRLPQGHCLLTGQENVGKTSLTKIATFIAGYEFFSIELSRGYGESNFRDDLKALYEKVCLQNQQVTFLFKDLYIVEENFLELINNMLTLGVVPALYDDEEKERILNSLRKEFSSKVLSKEMLWQLFAQKSLNNLHIVLNMNASNPLLAKRCRNFPGLVSNTHIDWVFAWPKQALYAVASSILPNEDEQLPPDVHQVVVEHCVFVHMNIHETSHDFYEKLRRKNYISPKNYLDFLNSFLRLISEQNSYILLQCNRLSEGMNKLVESAHQIDSLNDKLIVQRVAVAEKTQACSKLLDEISHATKEAEVKQALALNKSSQIEVQKVDITREKNEATKALSKAMPALEAAKHALDYIDKNDVTEIRSFTKPPLPVQTIGECIVVLKGIKDVSWKSAKALMADTNFLKLLKELDTDNIPMKNINIVKYYLKQMNVTQEEMKEKSKAGAGLMKFVQAVVEYCEVYKDVKPKKEKVEKLEREYNNTMQDFERITSQLNRIQHTLDSLKVNYEKAILEKKALEDETDLMQRRLDAADRLIKGLGSERFRWQKDLEDLADQKKYIIGNSLLCAGFLAYAAPFTWQYREELIYGTWKNNIKELNIQVRSDFSIINVLTNDVEISKWTSEGLPPDELSIQNAILATKASRFPLCIDPQQQATNWIKQKERNLRISSFNSHDYIKNLQLAVKYGTSFLFQEVDDYIDPLLDNVLAKNYDKHTGTVLMGDKRIDYDTNFQLYLTTKLPNPNYTATFFSLATVINFMVTMKGLEEQLLGVIVKIEKNELEERREQLIFETSNNKTFLKELEDSLLKELAQSTGNMLDNTYLLNTLESTKQKSSEVAEKLRLAALTTEEIDKNRDIYRPIAKLGALLFFVLADLSGINEMYQYSLSGYIKVFESSLKKSYPDIRIANRLKNISTSLLSSVYAYGCTGIFERHKLLFSMQMTVKLQLDEGNISVEELEFLTKGNTSLEKSEKVNPFEWIPASSWENIAALETVLPDKCTNLVEELENNEEVWKEWYEHDTPESVDFPMGYTEKLNNFQQLLLLRSFRLDRIYIAISDYIRRHMGSEFIQPPLTSLSNIYDQSSASTPIIFILSAGSDPTSDLLKFADVMDVKNTNVKILSLGQGQEKVALGLLSTAMIHGHWLILQNCHLLLKFMKEFEKEFESYNKPHPHFRLWLTTEPVDAFPISILQRSFKVVTEPPIGLKHNLQSIYIKLVPAVLEKESTHPCYPSLVYVLSFFHAVVQERRKYGKIGWNIAYDFNDSDFLVCNNILQGSLQKILHSGDPVPWMSLKYLIGQVMYGGRVIDDYDRRTIATYMDEYMGEFLLDPFQKFHFFSSLDYEYLLPEATLKEEFLEHIDWLPNKTTPMVLGLNDNAEISYFLEAGQSILEYMKRLQPKSVNKEASGSKEEIVDKKAKDILAKMQPKFLIDKIREEHENKITPSIVVLLQEIERFNLLTKKIVKSLIILRRGLAGEVGMDNESEDISNALYSGMIPQSWRKLAPDTKKFLGAWITFYLDRYKQYHEWAFNMEPEVMWISGLHIPGSYITALVQMTCRRNGWLLEKSTLFTKVTVESESNEGLDRISQGKAISGLYLEGAGWDAKNCCLKKQEPKKLSTAMPFIKIIPIQRSKLRLANTLRTPVYVTSDRRNAMGVGLVFEADLPTVHHLSHWILQGVCLVLNPE